MLYRKWQPFCLGLNMSIIKSYKFNGSLTLIYVILRHASIKQMFIIMIFIGNDHHYASNYLCLDVS